MFYLKTAKKTREVLSDYTVGRILDNMKPLLKEGKVLGPNQSKGKKYGKRMERITKVVTSHKDVSLFERMAC